MPDGVRWPTEMVDEQGDSAVIIAAREGHQKARQGSQDLQPLESSHTIYALVSSVNTTPHGMVPPGLGPGTRFPALGCARLLPIHLPFISSLSLISCKYHRIQHLPRLRPLSIINHPHPRPPQVHRGGGVHTITMAGGGGGGGVCDAGAYIPRTGLTPIFEGEYDHIHPK